MVEFAILAGYLLILTTGGVIPDYILPHIKPIMRWIDKLCAEKESLVSTIMDDRKWRI